MKFLAHVPETSYRYAKLLFSSHFIISLEGYFLTTPIDMNFLGVRTIFLGISKILCYSLFVSFILLISYKGILMQDS